MTDQLRIEPTSRPALYFVEADDGRHIGWIERLSLRRCRATDRNGRVVGSALTLYRAASLLSDEREAGR